MLLASRRLQLPTRKPVTALALSKDGLSLVAGDGTGRIHVYDFKGGGVYRHGDHHWGIVAIAISDDNAAIVSVAQGQKRVKSKSELGIWRVDTGSGVIHPNQPGLRYRCPRFLRGDYRFAVKHGTIVIYDPVTKNGTSILEKNIVDLFVISPDGRQLVFVAKHGPLHVWSLTEEADHPQRELEGHRRDDVEHIAFSGDGSLLATIDNRRGVRITDFQSGHLVAEASLPFCDDVLCCGWLPSREGWLLVDTSSQTWLLAEDGNVNDFSDRAFKGGATSAVVSSGSELVAFGNRKGRISVCDMGVGPTLAEVESETLDD